MNMKKWSKFSDSGDLPPGIHRSILSDVIEHLGKGSFRKSIVMHIYFGNYYVSKINDYAWNDYRLPCRRVYARSTGS